MNWAKLLGYGAGVIVTLVVLRVVVSAVLGFFGLLWSLINAAVPLVIAGAVVYGAYKLYQTLSDDSTARSRSTDMDFETEQEPEKTPQEQYAEGDIDEEELERQLEYELN